MGFEQEPVETLKRAEIQQTQIYGHLLPGADISKNHVLEYASGLASLTNMHPFGEPLYKDPTSYSPKDFKDLGGRPPEDINFYQMWDDSGVEVYIFPNKDNWFTIRVHTCKKYDASKVLRFTYDHFDPREDMEYSELFYGKATDLQPFILPNNAPLNPEAKHIKKLGARLEWINSSEKIRNPADYIYAHDDIEEIVKQAIADGSGRRLAACFTHEQKKTIQDIYGDGEIAIDAKFMTDVQSGKAKSPNEYPLQPMYDRLSKMEVEAAGITKNDRVLHYGAGYGGTGVGVITQFGIPFTCVDRKPDVARDCRQTFDKLGLLGKDKLQVACADARDIDPTGYDVIIISAMVPEGDKNQILDIISKLKWGKENNRRLIIRTPSSLAKTFFYPVLLTDKFLSRPELKLIADTGPMTGPDDPLRSLVFTVSDEISYRLRVAENKAGATEADNAIARLESQRPKLKTVQDFLI